MGAGVAVLNGSGNLIGIVIYADLTIHVQKFSTPSSSVVNAYTGAVCPNTNTLALTRFRIKADATNIYFYTSYDGAYWTLVYSELLSTFIGTITKTAIYLSNDASTGGGESKFVSWSVTYP